MANVSREFIPGPPSTLFSKVVVALLATPMVHAFGTEPAHLNTWVAYFPFVWLPAGLVSAAVLGHVLLWRRLLAYGMRGRASVPVS